MIPRLEISHTEMSEVLQVRAYPLDPTKGQDRSMTQSRKWPETFHGKNPQDTVLLVPTGMNRHEFSFSNHCEEVRVCKVLFFFKMKIHGKMKKMAFVEMYDRLRHNLIRKVNSSDDLNRSITKNGDQWVLRGSHLDKESSSHNSRLLEPELQRALTQALYALSAQRSSGEGQPPKPRAQSRISKAFTDFLKNSWF